MNVRELKELKTVTQVAERLKSHVRECGDCLAAIQFYQRTHRRDDFGFWLCREARDILMELFE